MSRTNLLLHPLLLLPLLAACSNYRRGEQCMNEGGGTIAMNGGPAFVVDEAAGCVRAGTEDVTLDLNLEYWCEWTNDGDEDPKHEPACSTSYSTPVRVGSDTCYILSTSCTDFAPFIDDDPVHNSSPESKSFCWDAYTLPSCEE